MKISMLCEKFLVEKENLLLLKICYFNYKVKINSMSGKIIDFDEIIEKSGESENWVVLIQLK